MNILARANDTWSNTIAAAKRYENPVVTKELRTRMRGAKAQWTMLIYVLAMSIAVLLVYYFDLYTVSTYSGSSTRWWQQQAGLHMFVTMTWLQMVVLSLVGASLTSGAFTMEIQQQTIELLSLTRLSPRNLVVGKTGTGVIFLWILLASTLPLSGLCLMFGGISTGQIAVTYLLLAAWTFLCSVIGVFCSAISVRTQSAVGATVITVLAYMVVTSVVAANASAVAAFGGRSSGGVFDLLNPAAGPYRALSVPKVFGIPVPSALIALVINGGLGVLLLAAAQTHLRYQRADKALVMRLLLMGLSAFTLLVCFGSMSVSSTVPPTWPSSDLRETATLMLAIIMGVVYVFIPAIATGAVKENGRKSSSDLSISAMFRQDIRGAIPFILTWLVLLLGVGLAVLIRAKAWDVIGGFIGVGVSMLAVAACYCAVGMLCSTFSKTRNQAMALTFLFMVATFLGYFGLLTGYQYGEQAQSPVYEAAYLWPVLPLVSFADNYSQDAVGPKLALWGGAHWFAVSLCYVLIGATALAMADRCRKRYKGIQDDRA